MIRKEFSPVDRASCRGLNSLCEGDRGPALARDDRVQLVVGAKRKLSLEGFDTGDAVSKVHASIVTPKRVYATPKRAIPKKGTMTDIPGMGNWPKKDAFSNQAKSYQVKTGKTQAQVADDLGVSLPTFRNYLYGSKTPGLATIQKAAVLFGCSITEFVDDPGAEAPTGPSEQKTELDQAREFIVDAMGSGITSRLTDDQILSAYRVALKTAAAMLEQRTK